MSSLTSSSSPSSSSSSSSSWIRPGLVYSVLLMIAVGALCFIFFLGCKHFLLNSSVFQSHNVNIVIWILEFHYLHIPAFGPTQPPIQWVPGDLSPRAKLQGREANHSPPASVEVKKDEAVFPLPHMSSWHSA
jgi:hypothetical protein